MSVCVCCYTMAVSTNVHFAGNKLTQKIKILSDLKLRYITAVSLAAWSACDKQPKAQQCVLKQLHCCISIQCSSHAVKFHAVKYHAFKCHAVKCHAVKSHAAEKWDKFIFV